MNIDHLRDELVSALGDNLLCLIHHGSHARGEARADSDYDFALILSKVDRKALDEIGSALSKHSDISVYILDRQDLELFPKALYATYLQFMYAEKIYGDWDFPKPSAEDIDTYLSIMRTDEISTLRHYLTLPHDPKSLVGRILLRLKNACFCLQYLAYKETGELPRTRLETINYLAEKRSGELGIRLLKILEDWPDHEASAAKNPYEYLHMLEEFWRTLTT